MLGAPKAQDDGDVFNASLPGCRLYTLGEISWALFHLLVSDNGDKISVIADMRHFIR